MTRGGHEFLIESSKRQTLAPSKVEIDRVIDRQSVCIREFYCWMHAVSTFDIMNQLQFLDKCEGFRARAAIDPIAPNGHRQSVREFCAENERDMAALTHHSVKNFICNVAAFVYERPGQRY